MRMLSGYGFGVYVLLGTLACLHWGTGERSVMAQGDAKGALTFSRDIAPVLVANCQRCHNPMSNTFRRHQFDISTFQTMMKGGMSGAVISPKKSGESKMIKHIKSEDDLPKMPPGGMNNLAKETVDKLESWINAGALLDAGKNPTAKIDTFAVTPEQMEREEMAKLTPEQRTQRAVEAGKGLFKRSNIKDEPAHFTSAHFVIVGNIPESRLSAATEALEKQYVSAMNLVTKRGGTPVLDPKEKVLLLVFKDALGYSEFVRSVENREVSQSMDGHARLIGTSPYVAVVDPAGGGEEPEKAPTKKKSASRKKNQEELSGPSRTLVGLLTQNLVEGIAVKTGKVPRYMALGLGAFFASRVEPDSPYYAKMRVAVTKLYRLGWQIKSQEILGDVGEPEDIQAMGFSMVEWLATSPQTRQRFPNLIQAMADQGKEKLDDILKNVYGLADREQFLNAWGAFVVSRYGRAR